jgi:hypothetical protein
MEISINVPDVGSGKTMGCAMVTEDPASLNSIVFGRIVVAKSDPASDARSGDATPPPKVKLTSAEAITAVIISVPTSKTKVRFMGFLLILVCVLFSLGRI